MALYHLHVKNVSRSHGRSAVAAAAYRAGETLPNEIEERQSAFGGRRDVRHTEIRLPDGAPAWAADRATLWNAVERAESRKDARLAKEIEFAIPRELPSALWVDVARAMADAYTSRGHVVDVAIHDDGSGHNPHVHLLLTTRAFDGNGFGGKMREADGLAFVTEARAMWASIANAALGKIGSGVEIDARSHSARGVDDRPGQHRGPDPAERRARRQQRKKAPAMMHDTIEARRELLNDQKALDRFPLLRARGDWPPEAEAPLNLTTDERDEFRAFWQEVYRRQLDPDRHPDPVAPPAAAPAPEAKREDQQPSQAILTPPRVPNLEPRHEMALSLWETTDKAAVQFAELELALARAQQVMGRDPLTPRSSAEWHEVLRASNAFKATMADLRAQTEQNRAYSKAFDERYFAEQESDPDPFPAQGPDGRPIAPSALDPAQDAMLADISRRDVPEPPPPSEEPATARQAAERAVLRDAHSNTDKLRRRDPALAWLDDPSPYQSSDARGIPTDPALQWLREDGVEPERADSPERDRDRDR